MLIGLSLVKKDQRLEIAQGPGEVIQRPDSGSIYVTHKLDPICRSRNGSYTVVGDSPHVAAEEACDELPKRDVIINMITLLTSAPLATQEELPGMLDGPRLFCRGCSVVDIGLLAGAMMSERTLIRTSDNRLSALASEFNWVYLPGLNFSSVGLRPINCPCCRTCFDRVWPANAN